MYNKVQHKTLHITKINFFEPKDDDRQKNKVFLTFILSLDVLFIYFTAGGLLSK